MIHRWQKATVRAVIESARKKAAAARKEGIVYTVMVGEIEIDATVLAFIPGKTASEHWITKCARSCARHQSTTKTQVRTALRAFWRGETPA